MRLKKSSFWSKIPNWVWVLISLAVAIAIWLFAAYTWPLVFATPKAVVDAFISKAASGVLWGHVWASLSRVLSGFAIAFVVSIPVAFLMAWYDPFRHVVEPWIQFIRNIPPLAYVFLIIAALGVGQVSKVTVIFIAAFLVMVITIYQGVKGVDTTLIKAARVLGAKQKDIRGQFVIEAGTTSAVGGGLGIVFGLLLARAATIAVGAIMSSSMNGITFSAVPTLSDIAVSFGVSVGIGVLFGYLPANKAAKLNPIDALRYD